MSLFEKNLAELIDSGDSSVKTTPTVSVKTASESPETEGLRKLASILRKTKVDPTYQELYSFVEGILR